MSGGHFDYAYMRLHQFADDLESNILNNDKPDEYGYKPGYSKETLDSLKGVERVARMLSLLMKEAEWLYSGDTDEKTFAERCGEILSKLEE